MRKPSFRVRFASYAVLTLFAVISAYPVLRVFGVALRPNDRLLTTSLRLIPENAGLQNFVNVVMNRDLLVWVANSLMITLPTSFAAVMLTATAAYALARMRFPGRRKLLMGMVVVQLIPGAASAMAVFLMIIRLGLINSHFGLIVAYTVGTAPFCIWLMRGYFLTIDPAMEESALVDGATPLQALVHIMLPLAAPIISVVFVLNFLAIWSEFMLARFILTRPHLLTWPVGLTQLQGQFTTAWGEYAAGGVLVGVPTMIVFALVSRHMSSGLTVGAVD